MSTENCGVISYSFLMGSDSIYETCSIAEIESDPILLFEVLSSSAV
jgi:hypothetical protein